MSETERRTAEIVLEYWAGEERAGEVYGRLPVEPLFTDELILAVRSDREEDDPRRVVMRDRPQIHLAGPARALEALGCYLIALARLETLDPDVHEHFEDVQNDDGGTVHLILRRLPDA